MEDHEYDVQPGCFDEAGPDFPKINEETTNPFRRPGPAGVARPLAGDSGAGNFRAAARYECNTLSFRTLRDPADGVVEAGVPSCCRGLGSDTLMVILEGHRRHPRRQQPEAAKGEL
jgi:hypothetical protein